jgi:hypothetical protein
MNRRGLLLLLIPTPFLSASTVKGAAYWWNLLCDDETHKNDNLVTVQNFLQVHARDVSLPLDAKVFEAMNSAEKALEIELEHLRRLRKAIAE